MSGVRVRPRPVSNIYLQTFQRRVNDAQRQSLPPYRDGHKPGVGSYRVVQKKCPLFKNSRPHCCHASGPAMDSPIGPFRKVPPQFSQLSAISFAQPCTTYARQILLAFSVWRCVKIFLLCSENHPKSFLLPRQNCIMAQYFSQPFPKPVRNVFTLLCTLRPDFSCLSGPDMKDISHT